MVISIDIAVAIIKKLINDRTLVIDCLNPIKQPSKSYHLCRNQWYQKRNQNGITQSTKWRSIRVRTQCARQIQ